MLSCAPSTRASSIHLWFFPGDEIRNVVFPPPACPKSRNFELQSASCKALEGVEPADEALFGRAPPHRKSVLSYPAPLSQQHLGIRDASWSTTPSKDWSVDSSDKLFVKLFFNVIKKLRVSAQREFNAASAFEAMFHKHGFIQGISFILGHELQPASQIIWRGYIPICFICPWNADFHNLRLNANSTILREEQIYCISYGKFATVGIPAYKALLCERAPMIAFFVIGKYKPSSVRFHIKQL